MIAYAERRVREHIVAFTNLYNQIEAGAINEPYLSDLEARDNIFPDISYRVFATPEQGARHLAKM